MSVLTHLKQQTAQLINSQMKPPIKLAIYQFYESLEGRTGSLQMLDFCSVLLPNPPPLRLIIPLKKKHNSDFRLILCLDSL